jgi:dolichol kinase/phosphoserine phosphatase
VKELDAKDSKKPKLVIFDVEGVLIPKNRLFFEVARTLGKTSLFKVLLIGFFYEIGILSLKKALTRIFEILKGTKIEVLTNKFANIPLVPSARKVVKELNNRGYKTALISSGLPTFLVEKIAATIDAEYAIGFEVGIESQALTGDVWGDVIEHNGKYLVFKELLEEESLSPKDCVIVADDRNNSSIFLKDAKKIGFEPDFLIQVKADIVISGRLEKILPLIEGEKKTKRFPNRKSLLREMIHGSGIFIPILAILFGVPIVALFIMIVVALYSLSEAQRVRGKSIPFFSTITRHAASASELRKIAFAPIYFAFGIFLTIILFPTPASSAAIAIFAFGDSAASLIGGTFSRKHLPYNGAKTLEGSLAFLLFSFVGALTFVSPTIAILGAAIGTFVEYLPLPINDNLLIPLVTALVLTFII